METDAPIDATSGMMGASFGSSTGAWWMKSMPAAWDTSCEIEAVAGERSAGIEIARCAAACARRYAIDDDGSRDQSGEEKDQEKTCDGTALH